MSISARTRECEGALADIVPRYRDLAPHIRRTLDRHAARAEILFETVPYCAMPGYERYVAEYHVHAVNERIVNKQLDIEERDWHLARVEQKTKFAQCQRCKSFTGEISGAWTCERFATLRE